MKTSKEDFASYLEETAAEIRAFNLMPTYLEDACLSLIEHTHKFWKYQEDENALKLVD